MADVLESEPVVDEVLAEEAKDAVSEPEGPRVIRYELLPGQIEFISSKALEVLYSGALGAGKTRALCIRAAVLASNPKARVGLCRKMLTDLKSTTLKTLLEPEGDLPPVLPPGSYTLKKQQGDMMVRLVGGGVIIPFGCDDPRKIGSRNFSDCLVDEAIELEEDEWIMLQGRCRISYTLPDGTKHVPSLSAATNPGPPSHFLHRRFFDGAADPAERHLICATSFDNWFLPKSWFDRYKGLLGQERERYLHGRWLTFEGAIFPMFQSEAHEQSFKGAFEYYVAGVDVGFTHPSAIRIHGIDAKDTRHSHVCAEFYQANVHLEGLVAAAKEAKKRYFPIVFMVPPEQPAVIDKFRKHNIPVKKADNDVVPGIQVLRDMLSQETDVGCPLLTFEPGLKGTREYLSYRWKPTGINEQPLKEYDDAIDADRYAVMEIRGRNKLRRWYPLGAPKKVKAVAEHADEEKARDNYDQMVKDRWEGGDTIWFGRNRMLA